MTDLDLVTAATPFFCGRRPITAAQRQRLREVVFAILRQRGAPLPPPALQTRDEAFQAFRDTLDRCRQLGVNWPDIVAVVNREWRGK